MYFKYLKNCAFKDGGKLKRNDSLTINDQTVQVTTDIFMW